MPDTRSAAVSYPAFSGLRIHLPQTSEGVFPRCNITPIHTIRCVPRVVAGFINIPIRQNVRCTTVVIDVLEYQYCSVRRYLSCLQ